MKLLHIATAARFLPFLNGQPRYLKARGFEVHVASSPGPELEAFARREGVAAWAIPMTRGLSPWRDLVALVRLLVLLARLRPQVVHAHTPKAALVGMLAAWLGRVPARLYTLHGLVWLSRTGWRRRLLVEADRLSARLAGRVLAVSESIRAQALAAGLAPPEKISMAAHGSANGIDGGRFDPARVEPAALQALRNRYRIPAGARVAGFVGRLVPDKGVEALGSVWRRLRERFPDLHLLIVGETESHDPLPQGVLERLGQDPRVHLAGWTTAMPEHYLLMDVCILPTRREGLPYAALEAQAMQVPVACFAAPGAVDAVVDGQTGRLAPCEDSAALAAAAAALLADPARARRMGRQGRRRVLELYRPEPVWAALHHEYLQDLEAAPPPRRWWKRPGDLLLCSALGPLAVPLALAVWVAVWLDVGRPVIYRQRRIGFRGAPFEMLKFRTMRQAQAGAPDSERLTRLGRWLRRSSLDELPQLVHILRGQMSFIGPRPLVERYLPYFTEREQRRHSVRPGLTGWAQIHGRNRLGWSERLEKDVWYVDHASAALDVRIAVTTLGRLVSRRGALEDPTAWMPDLDQERGGRSPARSLP